MTPNKNPVDTQLRDVLLSYPIVEQALVFGSVAQGTARPDSDLDIAVGAQRPLTQGEKMALINSLATQTGRPIDLIDLKTVSEPLLGQILKHGRRLLGSDAAYAQLITRHVFDQADFLPYKNRVLAERREAWIGK